MKVTDFLRARAIYGIYDLVDCNHNYFFSPFEWVDCKCKFGLENRKGICTCIVKVTILEHFTDGAQYVDYSFNGHFDCTSNLFQIKSVLSETPFRHQRLISVNNNKVNCVWLEEEGDVADAAHATALVEVESGSENSVNTSVL